MTPSRLLAVGLASLSLGASVACASPAATGQVPPLSAAPAPASPSPAASASPMAHLGAAPSPSPGTSEALVALAVADAAQRSGAAASDVVVERVEPREWPDRSLGCPKPGVGYAQVLTPGFLIVVQVRGRRLEYHSDQVQVITCDA